MAENTKHLDLDTFRTRFDAKVERTHWMSLHELGDEESFFASVSEEFPQQAIPLQEGVDRRDFVKLMGSSLALAGLAGCTVPKEKIVPYVRQPEAIVPGKPQFFATAMTLGGVATGLLVESHMGRPTKIEGNPDHPGSMGATDVFAQASILGLYDPDRAKTVRQLGNISTWTNFLGALGTELKPLKDAQGAGLAILTEPVTSPTLGAQMRALLAALPKAQWHQWEPHGRDNALEGARVAFGGSFASTWYALDKADVVVSLDSDFLASGPGSVRYANDFMSRRRIRRGTSAANRLYVVETMPTPTGSAADHRLPLKPSEVESFAFALAAAFGAGPGAKLDDAHEAFLRSVVKDLEAARGRCVVIAGADQPATVHALAHAINATLGNAGTTVFHAEPADAVPAIGHESLRQLAADMTAGTVKVLLMVGVNPAYDAPADLGFAAALDKIPFRASLSMYFDETAELCHWHVPQTHYLESWGDARAFNGAASIVQPLIAPLYQGRDAIELFAILLDDANMPYDIIRNYWKSQRPGIDFETAWNKWLRDGVIEGTAFVPKAMTVALGAIAPGAKTGEYEICFRPDPAVWDGRFANNGWLQELPKPMTKLTWDNAALMSPATATKLGLVGDRGLPGEGNERNLHLWSRRAPMVEIKAGNRTLRAAAWVVPGHPDDAITLHTGYGRTRGGSVATPKEAAKGGGFNAYTLRSLDGLGHAVASVGMASGDYQLACTQLHHVMPDEREIVRSGTLEDFVKNPALAEAHNGPHSGEMSLYPKWESETGYAWGLAVDTTVCTGCNGCVIACHAENNIAIVGKPQVMMGRELHWMRIDTYYKGSPASPELTINQPLMCQHCENAPCEPVCPVEATSHSTEGLNEMTYNRCVGTRYCANNCPYKVRRFNYFQFSDWDTESLKLMRNPDVTVRSRGVMEKCSLCVQRINSARIDAEREGRRVRDGEIRTACQAACPTQAIVFGDIADPNSLVSKLKAEPHSYRVLEEVNTNPRTSYLGAVRNKNKEIAG
ncbi:MAG: TAT-variant-translocated molybdopterin oxidoreductase [Acidobacteria bacterium]|nr:TAT-variant-translocated molybdopterin oxidoreductase [Acidobacteriota bacterium]